MKRTWTMIAAVGVTGMALSVVAPGAAIGAGTRTEAAKKILADKGISLLKSHVSGKKHAASTAYQNVVDTSKGKKASTSPWSHVGVKKVNLSAEMLTGMVSLGKTYSYRVTTIAGGAHSKTSFHYVGHAVDVDRIDGKAVNSGNSKVAKFKKACRSLGADEILGPGDAGHATHIHCAWR